jgi:mannose-6-phosphate isomerase-like protein (cupin superfamily)
MTKEVINSLLQKPTFHKKGWGCELWLTNNNKYCGKILQFNAGKKCSFHYHLKKHEHFYVLEGQFSIILSNDDEYNIDNSFVLAVGSVLEIPIGVRHQMIANMDSKIIEISTEHFENDSYRVIKGD